MDIHEKTLNLLKDQSALLIDLTQRMMILNAAFEAFVRRDVTDFDSYVQSRKEIFAEENQGQTVVLLQALQREMDRTETDC